ncbi:thioesterase domain-containing protein [Hirsutella rhossiliensis]|uniref:Thioesterase domain-containing protein n=1 Tax=Hirsutella rhossiliensis TaxID=111463 RepID=A0A9P8SH94_9HYPO|nr:thioesterase domain-containing protein [Hirsutella rhossiliensis]KAH0962868.1 thioesterase domain-containing protein [Hirsutella rhossiliensis]
MFAGDTNPVEVQFVPPHKRAKPPTPLVLIHDGGGTVFSYYLLGSLRRDVWAIYDPKYFDGEPWEGGMDEMARHYIDLLVKAGIAGIAGTIILGGWSLGCLLSLTMAHMLAHDPSTNISIAGILSIDSPYHIASSKLTAPTSEAKIEDITDLVQKSFENCDVMLREWDLPSWQGPSGGGREVEVRVAGQSFTLQPGRLLYKPLGEDWKPIIGPPPGVMIRCTRPAEKVAGSGPEPASIDRYRNETLLGWEGNYADFIRAVIDVDDDHYKIFDKYDEDKIQNLTSQVNAGLEILDSLSRPSDN